MATSYHLWIYDTDRQSLNVQLNSEDVPRIWKDHQGPWMWAKKWLQYGTSKTIRCECATPCVYVKHRY